MKTLFLKKRHGQNARRATCFPHWETVFPSRWTLALAAVFTLSACATTGSSPNPAAPERSPQIDELFLRLSNVDHEDASLLAPESYDKVKAKLGEAISLADSGDIRAADRAADAGLDLTAQLEKVLAENRGIFHAVIDMRDRALEANARSLFPTQFENADTSLRERAAASEGGDAEVTEDQMSTLADRYASLENVALKKDLISVATSVTEHAEQDGAKAYAPRTIARARQKLDRLISENPPNANSDKAIEARAESIIWWAHRADEITRLAKRFEALEMDREHVILWYQAQLLSIRSPLKEELPFDRANAEVVEVLREDISGLLASVDQMRERQHRTQQKMANLRREMDELRAEHARELEQAIEDIESDKTERIKALQERVAKVTGEEAREARRRERREQRFQAVRELFSAEQGEVLRKGDNVILRLHGFYFPPGKSDIEARNFGLMNDIVAAIQQFPDAMIKVIGHTDNRGDDDMNTELSIQRAKSVATYLRETGGISRSRIESQGRGETEPVATNDTEEGRAKNRRIEVIVLNEANVPYTPSRK